MSATATAPRQRDTYRMAARRLLRDTVLDSVRALLADRPWAQITMADVAASAGVSRQTLYNELGSRDQLAQAFVIREGERFIEDVEGAIEQHLEDPVAALAAALEVFLAAAAEDPLVAMLRGDDGTGEMLPLLTTRSGPVLAWATQRLAAAVRRGWPQVAAHDAQLLAEALVRLAISHITVPIGSSASVSEDTVRLLAPFIERAVAKGV